MLSDIGKNSTGNSNLNTDAKPKNSSSNLNVPKNQNIFQINPETQEPLGYQRRVTAFFNEAEENKNPSNEEIPKEKLEQIVEENKTNEHDSIAFEEIKSKNEIKSKFYVPSKSVVAKNILNLNKRNEVKNQSEDSNNKPKVVNLLKLVNNGFKDNKNSNEKAKYYTQRSDTVNEAEISCIEPSTRTHLNLMINKKSSLLKDESFNAYLNLLSGGNSNTNAQTNLLENNVK